MLAQIGEIEDLVNMAQEVMGGNVGIEVEREEKTRFAAALASHHPGLAVERSHPSIAAGALCSRCFSTESAKSRRKSTCPKADLQWATDKFRPWSNSE